MAVYNPNSMWTWSQYLQANSFVQDVTGEVKKNSSSVAKQIVVSSEAISRTLSDQTKQIVASNRSISRALGTGFNEITGTVEWGFNRINAKLKNIDSSLQGINSSIDVLHSDIEGLRSDFNYTMGLLLQQSNVLNKTLQGALEKLDEIHETLKSPLLTRARESYRLGCERLAKGLLDKALEKFLDAAKENDTDFFIQFQIGNLYLYGVNEEYNVIDVEKAKVHLLYSARYAKAEKRGDPSFGRLEAQAYFHASIANLAIAGESYKQISSQRFSELIEESLTFIRQTIALNGNFPEAYYHSAKYAALLGNKEGSLADLEKAIFGDRNYALKVDIDPSFDKIRESVLGLMTKMRDSVRDELKRKIKVAERAIDQCHEVKR